MKDEPQKLDQTAAVYALIDRMQPGEVLHLGERPVAQYFYARLLPEDGECLECVSPNYEALNQIQTMIKNMVTAGVLTEKGDGCYWIKDLSSSSEQKRSADSSVGLPEARKIGTASSHKSPV